MDGWMELSFPQVRPLILSGRVSCHSPPPFKRHSSSTFFKDRGGGEALHPGVSHLLIRPVTATIVLLYTSNVYLIHSTFSLFTRISILQEDRPFLVGVDLFFFFSSWASHNYWEMVNGRSISFVVVLPLIMAKGQGIYIRRGWGGYSLLDFFRGISTNDEGCTEKKKKMELRVFILDLYFPPHFILYGPFICWGFCIRVCEEKQSQKWHTKGYWIGFWDLSKANQLEKKGTRYTVSLFEFFFSAIQLCINLLFVMALLTFEMNPQTEIRNQLGLVWKCQIV